MDEDRRIATHEAGHAVAAVLLGDCLDIVTINSDFPRRFRSSRTNKLVETKRNDFAGLCCFYGKKRLAPEVWLKVFMAGEESEWLLASDLYDPCGSTSDRKTIEDSGIQLLSLGRVLQFWRSLDADVSEALKALRVEVQQFILEHEDKIQRLADALIERRTMSDIEVKEVLGFQP